MEGGPAERIDAGVTRFGKSGIEYIHPSLLKKEAAMGREE